MEEEGAFWAVLSHPPERCCEDRALLLPAGDHPPPRLRLPTVWITVDAFDVYTLVDRSQWPESAAFAYAGTIPRTVIDPPQGDLRA